MGYAYYVRLPLRFPNGVHFGAGKSFNVLTMAIDGEENAVLNGTSIAGVMRSIWRNHLVSELPEAKGASMKTLVQLSKNDEVAKAVSLLFGAEQDKLAYDDVNGEMSLEEKESRVRFTNYELNVGRGATRTKTHHIRNRHRGTVLDKGLFSLQATAPGTTANVEFWVFQRGSTTDGQIEEFLNVVVASFHRGVSIGGNSNRGIGLAKLESKKACFRKYDLKVLDEHAEQLDAYKNWRLNQDVANTQPLLPEWLASESTNELRISFTLQIPPGQDILVGDGQAADVQIEPQHVLDADGNWNWLLPGSTVRGIFRSWCNHLAAHDDEVADVADAAAEYDHRIELAKKKSSEEIDSHDEHKAYTPENLGWSFEKRDWFDSDAFETEYDSKPVVTLFGSCHAPGRIKISDGLSKCSIPGSDGDLLDQLDLQKCDEAQTRMHVAVDRITGGAAEGMLFANRVLTALNNEFSPEFEIEITITAPKPREAKWIGQTLVAVHIGLLRVGSSKSAGRLQVKSGSLHADGPPESKTEFQNAIDSILK